MPLYSTIRHNNEYSETRVLTETDKHPATKQKNCQVITNVKKDYQKGEAVLTYGTYCENNDGVITKTVHTKVCQLKLVSQCTTKNCEIEEEMVCPDTSTKYQSFSKTENNILWTLVPPVALAIYWILSIKIYLESNRQDDEEIRDCFSKDEELKDEPIEKYLKQALACQNTLHEFKKILTNTKSEFIIAQFNSIPSKILQNINEPWLNRWYKIFGKNEWLSKLFGYKDEKDEAIFFESLKHIKNIAKDGIDITLEKVNISWSNKWYKIFGKNEWLSKLFWYKDAEKICDEIYYHLLELDPTIKKKEIFYKDLQYHREEAIEDIKIEPLISKLQQQKTISSNQVEYLKILHEDISDLIQYK